jgi:hypothetical protein
MFYNILDKKREEILPILGLVKDNFYLAGGTALALHLGHRDSLDFDFFSEEDFDTGDLFEKLREIFKDHNIQKIQDEENTLTVVVDDEIKISFFTYKCHLLNPLIFEKYLHLASVQDIACMKLAAIVSRSTEKDYVDLFFILQNDNLSDLLKLSKEKFPTIDTNLILKSLIYFDDITQEEIIFKNDKEVSLDEIKTFFQEVVRNVLKSS